MCGLAGAWWASRPPEAETQVNAAVGAILHRGPDAQKTEMVDLPGGGAIGFGHARLAILDLSPAGEQPMWTPDGRYSVVYNGEIYNYIELRTELQLAGRIFTTDSDTEVLLQAWDEWGAACLSRLTGMFAFAILDRQSDTLICARDPFGIKPLFFTRGADGRQFSFASELPALLAMSGVRPRLNWQRAYDYLVYGDYDSDPATFFEGVNQLEPGSFIVLDLKTGNLGESQSYWMPSIEERSDLSYSQASEQFRALFLDSVKLHLRSDVPLGFALSGGLDSTAIVSAVRHLDPHFPINTFSYIDDSPAKSEEKWIDLVNDRVGARSHKIRATSADLINEIESLIRHQGEPFGSTSIFAQYMMFRRAREEGMVVMLEGQGADELMAGYDGYGGARLHSILEVKGPFAAGRFLHAWQKWPGRKHGAALRMMAGSMAPPDTLAFFKKVLGEDVSPAWLNRAALAERGVELRVPRMRLVEKRRGRRLAGLLRSSTTRQGLPSLLRHGDRNAMRSSLEGRVPFLTRDLAEFCLSLPESYILDERGTTKAIMRTALRGIMPDEILDRRDKIGFGTSELDWLRAIEPWIMNSLARAERVEILNADALRRQISAVLSGQVPFSWSTWRAINLVLWAEMFGVETS